MKKTEEKNKTIKINEIERGKNKKNRIRVGFMSIIFLCNQLNLNEFFDLMKIWSGKRGSNSRPQPWQGCALPTELFPRKTCLLLVPGARLELARLKKPRDFKSLVSTDFTTRAF